MAECLCVDCVTDRALKAKGLTSESSFESKNKMISFKTNCAFFESKYHGFLYGSNKPVLDGNILAFLRTNSDKGIKVTLTLLDPHPRVRGPNCKSHKRILKLLKNKPLSIVEIMTITKFPRESIRARISELRREHKIRRYGKNYHYQGKRTPSNSPPQASTKEGN